MNKLIMEKINHLLKDNGWTQTGKGDITTHYDKGDRKVILWDNFIDIYEGGLVMTLSTEEDNLALFYSWIKL